MATALADMLQPGGAARSKIAQAKNECMKALGKPLAEAARTWGDLSKEFKADHFYNVLQLDAPDGVIDGSNLKQFLNSGPVIDPRAM